LKASTAEPFQTLRLKPLLALDFSVLYGLQESFKLQPKIFKTFANCGL